MTAAFRSVNPRAGAEGATFEEATSADIAAACEAAARAFRVDVDRTKVASVLRSTADGLEELGDELITVADDETALGAARLTGERARTCAQLRAFADLATDGSHLEPIVDPATGEVPDVRRMMVPIGPVAVFGASNFPLAFSVPGGDTASALAAGCPVVAKGHPSHPATSELCARTIAGAVDRAGLPAGTFSMVQGASADVGRALVLAPQIRAVGFTGSHQAGRTLFELGATRPSPIPVYAEMGSLNPVFVTRAAIEDRAATIAKDLAGSITLGHGQFCTKPGLVFVPDDEQGQTFIEDVATQVLGVGSQPMLNRTIARAYDDVVTTTSSVHGVESPGVTKSNTNTEALWSEPALFVAGIDVFLRDEHLRAEHFGPAAIVVCCPEKRFVDAARRIDGSLTATIHAQPGPDDGLVGELLPELVQRAGRIVFDGVPTGVAVVPAMVHGGPYPATTSVAHTSVGLTAIRRWLRPVAFQSAPRPWLPPELRGER